MIYFNTLKVVHYMVGSMIQSEIANGYKWHSNE